MRILIVTPLTPPDPGGPSYYSAGLCEALKRAGHTVDVEAFSSVRHLPSGLRHLLFLYKVLLAGVRADAFFILDTVSVALPAVLAGWVLNKRTIIRTGGDFVWEAYVERTGEKVKLSEFYAKPRALSRKEQLLMALQKNFIFKLAGTIVFSTQWQRDIWRAPYGIPDAKTAVVGNVHGGGPNQPSAGTRKRTESANTFLWVGRDIVLKNVDILKHAFEQVKERYPQMVLTLLTNVPREQVEKELRVTRALVLPSISEVSPNIVFEALARGVPVICTADTGIRDSAPAGVVFVDMSDEGALTKALLDMCNADTYARVREAAGTPLPVRTYDEVAKELLDIHS